jgi:hypothetical protein
MDQELLQCFHSSKVHMRSIKNSPPNWNKLIRLSNSPILPSTSMGLISYHLGLGQFKDRMIKSSTMSQALLLNHHSRGFISFQNKIQRFLCMTLSSLSLYVVFLDPYQGITCCLCFPTSKAFVKLIGMEKLC